MKVGAEVDMGCKVACSWVAAVVKLGNLNWGLYMRFTNKMCRRVSADMTW